MTDLDVARVEASRCDWACSRHWSFYYLESLAPAWAQPILPSLSLASARARRDCLARRTLGVLEQKLNENRACELRVLLARSMPNLRRAVRRIRTYA